MKYTFRRIGLVLVALAVMLSSVVGKTFPKREMRGVWIATVANIDWPSSMHASSDDQRDELLTMLDQFAELKINTVIFQARPTADAFFYSKLEPWSMYLTGRQGQEPTPFFDPLQFLIEEAHKRCIDVHVWLNPYRMLNNDAISGLHNSHIYHTKPYLFVKYGGKYYFNPGLEETRQYLNKIVKDLVERYDVDAIHFDDYFYPYPVGAQDFPDNDAFRKYPRGFTNKADWRRNNVNMVISELKHTIQSIKPWVEFGISPFGVWRNQANDPRGSATRAGVQNYDDLYADILKWLNEGTIDYVVPQLYWEIGKTVADYEILIDWWARNSYDKNLYIGLFASGLGIRTEAAWKRPNELARQLRMNEHYPEVDGVFFYSARPFLRNLQGLTDSLRHQFYLHPSIPPVNRNLVRRAAIQPQNIRVLKDHKEAIITWDPVEAEGGDEIAYYVVYYFKGRKPGSLENAANILTITPSNVVDLNKIRQFRGNYTFVVTAVNRYKEESSPQYAVTRRM